MKQRRTKVTKEKKVIKEGIRNGKMALLSPQQRVCHFPVICILIACLPQIDSITNLSLENGP